MPALLADVMEGLMRVHQANVDEGQIDLPVPKMDRVALLVE